MKDGTKEWKKKKVEVKITIANKVEPSTAFNTTLGLSG